MNRNHIEILHKNPLFSVHIVSKDCTQYSWDFILTKENHIVLASKSILQNKNPSKKIYKASSLRSKPDFTIETDFTLPCKEYAYLPRQFFVSSRIEARHCLKRPSHRIVSWFSRIAPLLLSIEKNDSLLAAEIFHKNASIFMQYPSVTIKLLENISVEGLFSWIWGRFDEKAMSDLKDIFDGKCIKNVDTWDVAEAFFTSARRRLALEQKKAESIEDCMIRYFKSNKGTRVTLGIVGSKHYKLIEKNLYLAQETKKDPSVIFSNAQTTIQVDSSNEYDKNALAVFFENSLSGYIRKTGASLLRKALPHKCFFSSRLARLGYSQGGATGIVVEVVV